MCHLHGKHHYDVVSPVTVGLRVKMPFKFRDFLKKIFVAIMKGWRSFIKVPNDNNLWLY